MRERLYHSVSSFEIFRITPAYAGKTADNTRVPFGSQDHPRVCGKDMDGKFIDGIEAGSPPRMRERLMADIPRHYFFRITPAYAGKTAKANFGLWVARDHPRVCGKDSNRSPILSHSSDPHQRNFFTFVESA